MVKLLKTPKNETTVFAIVAFRRNGALSLELVGANGLEPLTFCV
jgi:hypothetical protein